ncbi:MAG: hypothetical protein V1807_01545 [Patescibacteria group bacterium]
MKKHLFRAGLLIIAIMLSWIAIPAPAQAKAQGAEFSPTEMTTQLRAQEALKALYKAEHLYKAMTGHYASFKELQAYPAPIPGTAFIAPTYSLQSFIGSEEFRFTLMTLDGGDEKQPLFVAVAWPMPDSEGYPIMITDIGVLFKLVPVNASLTPSQWRETIGSEEEARDETGQYKALDVSRPAESLFLSDNADEYIIQLAVIRVMTPTVLKNTVEYAVYLKVGGLDGFYVGDPMIAYAY